MGRLLILDFTTCLSKYFAHEPNRIFHEMQLRDAYEKFSYILFFFHNSLQFHAWFMFVNRVQVDPIRFRMG